MASLTSEASAGIAEVCVGEVLFLSFLKILLGFSLQQYSWICYDKLLPESENIL
jgi:hypothetical protein